MIASALTLLILLTAAPVFAQSAPPKQHTDGEAPTTVGPGSQAFKQQTDGESPTIVGPGSRAYTAETASGKSN